MTKEWKKAESNSYELFINNEVVAKMKLAINSINSKAECQVGAKHFIIHRTGFWKTSIEIADAAGQVLLKTNYEKWYANSSVFEFGGKKYRLVIHNNPLAEWAIMENGSIILAYGLQADNGKVGVKITGIQENNDLLFDLLLWYLFVPVATESMGDDFTFLLLVA